MSQEKRELSAERLAFYKGKHHDVVRNERRRARRAQALSRRVVEESWTERYHVAFPLSQIAVPWEMLTWKELWYRRFDPDECARKLHTFEKTLAPALQAAAGRATHDEYTLGKDYGLTNDEVAALQSIVIPPFWEAPRTTSEKQDHAERLESLWSVFVNPLNAITISWRAPGLYSISKDGRHRLMAAKLLPEEFNTIPCWVQTPPSLSWTEEAAAIADAVEAAAIRSGCRSMWTRLRQRIVGTK